MSNWRAQILKEFAPGVARLTLVADPDSLLLEEVVLEGIRERGFELIPFEDPAAFRYAYETKFRSCWDRGEETDLAVVLRLPSGDLGSLPYDLLQAGRKLSFSLGAIFPNLSYPVLTSLDRGDLDALYEAQESHVPGQLGENATKEFVLRHVFEIAPELIKQPSDLLRVLLRRHYHGRTVPRILDERFVQLLRKSDVFNEWPLEVLGSDREAFFRFLQERWPSFLDRMTSEDHQAAQQAPTPEFPGPINLPFEHHDVRVYVDNLFREGLLKPVPRHEDALPNAWYSIGICTDPLQSRLHRMTKLLETLESSIPTAGARHEEWFRFARRWAELMVLSNAEVDDAAEEKLATIKNLRDRIDESFTAWLSRRYAGLINLPPVPPVMLHHIPRLLARLVDENPSSKFALLVVDGLSLDQWIVMCEALGSCSPQLRFKEDSVFAWIPSITSVSRQALFSGKLPMFFPSSILTTEKESSLWKQFWIDQGLTQSEVMYERGLGDGSLEHLAEKLSDPRVRVAGLVVDMVDRIMHGMELGTSGMHNQIRQWVQGRYLTNLLFLLLAQGFKIFLTSDHGNVQASGCGSPAEGAVAELRGERARIYSDSVLRSRVKESFPLSLEWDPVGLPEDFLVLLASNRKAFTAEGKRVVSHGGISVEEVIVPFIAVGRKGA
ncbi:MAG: BREX-3 system phosphatase PglZ [Thermodesulfobacteriota bacterium]